MSPLPSPRPIRQKILRAMFSPIGLLCGFVVLLIATCPGARGEGALGLLAASEFAAVSGADVLSLDKESRHLVASSAAPRGVVAPRSSARSATPAERRTGVSSAHLPGRPAASGSELFRHTRSALPLLVDPVTTGADLAPSASIRPMVGPAVGIRTKLPATLR